MRSIVDRFFRMKCAPDILAKLGPGALDTKELCEILCTWDVICKETPPTLRGDPDIVFLDIGSGTQPRAAMFVAHLTKWMAIAIDPRLRDKQYNTERLQTHKSKVEDVVETLFISKECKAIIAVYIHSHATVHSVMKMFNKAFPLWIIALPCCTSTQIEKFSGTFWTDNRIPSPKNTFYSYKNRAMEEFLLQQI